MDNSNVLAVISIWDLQWSGQVRDLVLSAVTHIIWFIWFARNQLRFNNQSMTVSSIRHLISASVAMSGNLSLGKSSSLMLEFQLLKSFHVSIHHPKAPQVIQVNWYKPPCGWFKCNSDGASRGNPGLSAYGGIFRDSSGAILGCFYDFIGISTSFTAELVGAMKSIELAHEKG